MKKKELFLILFLFTHFIFFSQTKTICGKIKYKFTTNLAYKYVENYTLTFNSYESFCLEENVDKEESKKTQEDKEEGLQQNFVLGRKNTTSKYYYNTQNNFYVRDNYLDNVLLFKERPLTKRWQLNKETKKLSNFICNKATIIHRGRKYTAWYTTKIPLPFGPWKLRGLPGIILEFYDDDKAFHVIASQVLLNNKNCKIDIDKKELEKAT